ncbi:uncharacterized protein LOC116301638 isoform X2 [Actinia tenebrosa]|nr:uncharacterized protein LOC116301638 isoform X2 [Actinia tenebrosa]
MADDVPSRDVLIAAHFKGFFIVIARNTVMLPSLANITDQSTLKSLLNQLLLSGMSIPHENQSIDYRRLQEELLRSSQDTRGSDGAGSGGFAYRDSRDMNSQYGREKYGLNQKRDYQDDRSDRSDQDRSNFFGGALERKETIDYTDRWQQQSADFDKEWENRRQEMMGIRDGIRKTRPDDLNRDRDVRGSSFFNTSLAPTNILSNLQLPITLGSNQESNHGNMGSDLWPVSSEQLSMGYMYGMKNNVLGLDSTSTRPVISAFDPPLPNAPKPNTSEKPEGCHTIFIGGLPESVTEEIITEIFSMCGTIQSIRISPGKLGKNFCHVRFMDPHSVDMALGYSGYRLVITSEGQMSGGRIHVDYAKSREDEKEYERILRAKAREVRHQSEMEEKRVIFSERSAADLMKSIRSDSGFFESFSTLIQWLERGECTRKNSSTFYNLLSSVHSHVRRLIREKREHEETVERQKQEQLERVKLIMSQGASILKVFNAASKKKCWDHFSKAQRRNITDWHQQVDKEIKISTEEQMENRVEVGMDIDDEVGHIQSTSEYSQPEEENSGEPVAKQAKLEELSASESEKTQSEASQEAVKGVNQTSLDATAQAALKAKDIKYRAQAAGLKALAEKNTSLMWQVEGYKNEILLLKQKFASVFQEKDLQIARLMTAVQALQNFLQHVNLNTNTAKTTHVEVGVTQERGDLVTENAEETTEGIVVENNESDNESTEMVDAESTWDEEHETGNGNEDQSKENNSSEEELERVTKVDEEKGDEEVETGNGNENQCKENNSSEEELERVTKVDEEKSDEEVETTDRNDGEAAEDAEKEPEEETTLVNDIGENTQVNKETADVNARSSPNIVKLSSSEMVVVGCLCSYLQICPYGATTDQVLSHITRQVSGVTPEDLERILNGLPMLFSGDGLDFMSKTWKFNVLNM